MYVFQYNAQFLFIITFTNIYTHIYIYIQYIDFQVKFRNKILHHHVANDEVT